MEGRILITIAPSTLFLCENKTTDLAQADYPPEDTAKPAMMIGNWVQLVKL